jgi:hypothetical protein
MRDYLAVLYLFCTAIVICFCAAEYQLECAWPSNAHPSDIELKPAQRQVGCKSSRHQLRHNQTLRIPDGNCQLPFQLFSPDHLYLRRLVVYTDRLTRWNSMHSCGAAWQMTRYRKTQANCFFCHSATLTLTGDLQTPRNGCGRSTYS